jgi:FMN phosphatase YigB (HAD superfamily)
MSVRAVLWDADGVLQDTPVRSWDVAVQVVSRFPGAMTGAPIDDERIRTVARELGLAKPSTAFFEHIATDLELAPDQMLFLDDQPRNVAGARSAGLHAEHWAHDHGVTRLRALLAAHGVETG